MESQDPRRAAEVLCEMVRDVKRTGEDRVWALRRLGQFHRDTDLTWLRCLARSVDLPEVVSEAKRILERTEEAR